MKEKYRQIIRELLASGLTQGDLALAADVHQSTISRLQSGETRYPSLPAAIALEKLHEKHVVNLS